MHALENQIIARLPGTARGRLLRLCTRIQLKLADVLSDGKKPIQHVYFPIDSFISLVTLLEGKPVLEVGMVGWEGLVGAQLALGTLHQPLHAVVQGAGTAWRVGSHAFRAELARSPTLRHSLSSYLHVTFSQLASCAACLRFHHIGPRLARWLLMTQDRARSSSFHLTHEFLAFMLGVRRVGITHAATVLQRQGLITYRRGDITVLNRHGLLKAACTCYAAETEIYARLLN